MTDRGPLHEGDLWTRFQQRRDPEAREELVRIYAAIAAG
jgi:hypothetical protein